MNQNQDALTCQPLEITFQIQAASSRLKMNSKWINIGCKRKKESAKSSLCLAIHISVDSVHFYNYWTILS